MATDPTKYAERIAALLAKAQDPAATPAEAESYTAKAEELMVRWGISDAMVNAKREGEKAEKVIEERFTVAGLNSLALVELAFSVGRGLGTVRILKARDGSQREAQRIYVIGHESDVKRYRTLYDSLVLQAMAARDAWWKEENKTTRYTQYAGRLARRQFVMSFGHTVGARLAATRKTEEDKAVKYTKSTELVLRDRQAAVDDWMARMYPKLGKGRAIAGSHAGRAAGQEAGRKANIGQTSVGGSGKAIDA
jgi:hypothetical protein